MNNEKTYLFTVFYKKNIVFFLKNLNILNENNNN